MPMKTSELMIGDWVMYDEFIDKSMNHPKKIIHLDRDSVAVKRYYPIPLTPEILEKNGFKRDAFTNLSPDYYYDDDCQICINLNSTCDKLKSIWVENRKSRITVSIEESRHSLEKKPLYVHQLQQLLRIVGITKEIEL